VLSDFSRTAVYLSPGAAKARGGGWLPHFAIVEEGAAGLMANFVHAILDAGWPQQSLTQLSSLQPGLWPTATESPHTFELLRTNALRQNQD
jgi:hypothetical protein